VSRDDPAQPRSPGGYRVRAPWWPVEFCFRYDDQAAARWAEHHWYQSPPLAGFAGPPAESVVQITTWRDPTAVRQVHQAASAGGGHAVGAYGQPAYFVQPVLTGSLARSYVQVLLGRTDAGAASYFLGRGHSGDWHVVLGAQAPVLLPDKRLAAEIMRGQLAGYGGVELHAAAVSLAAGRAVALVGGSGSGKTTAALVLGAQGRLCSGDRVTLLSTNSGVRLAAYPDALRLGFGTAQALGADEILCTRPLLRPQDFRTPAGGIDDECWRPGSRRKISLTRREVEELLGIPVGSVGPLTDLVVLRRAGDAGPARLTRMPPSEALAAVAAQDMRLRAEYQPWLRAGDSDGTPPADRGLLSRILGSLRVWSLDWIPSVTDARCLAEAILR
jgi:hypothetical protein